MAAMAGVGPDGTFGPSDNFGRVLNEALKRAPVALNGMRAQHVNVTYGEHDRNRFDLWMVTSKVPTPLVVFIHGGGFRRGDKALLYDSKTLSELLDAGISVAAINYRFASQSPDRVVGCLRDAARFIQFVRYHSELYNVDKNRIGCFGGSAGASASLWLAFRDDRADPKSEDPVARESTRIACAGATSTPSTSNVLAWVDILGISRDQAMGFARALGRLAEDEDLESPEFVRIRNESDPLRWMSADDPPIYLFNNETGEVPTHYGHMGHHPNHVKVLKNRASQLGIEVVAYAPEIGIKDPSGEDLVGFFVRLLKP